MDVGGFSRHIFWSYDTSSDVEPGVAIRQVIAYGEVKDMILLARKLKKEEILNVINKWKDRDRFEKHIHFFMNVILD